MRSLRHTTPTVMGMATVSEPVGSTVIAWLWWQERIGGQVLLGSALILVGVVAALAASQPAR